MDCINIFAKTAKEIEKLIENTQMKCGNEKWY